METVAVAAEVAMVEGGVFACAPSGVDSLAVRTDL